MSHDLENVNGKTSFASFRQPAWHQLGQIVDSEMTTAEILAEANLDNWNVRGIPLTEFLEDTPVADSTGKKLIVRDRPGADEDSEKKHDILGVVGGRYGIVQNEELFDFGQALLGDEARWETAGSIRQGTTVFGSLALDLDITVDENGVADKVTNYLLISTTHDGSGPLFAGVTPVRVVCANTYNFALKGGLKNTVKIRHTSNAAQRMEEAKKVIDYTLKYTEEFADSANKLFETEITNQQFEDLVKGFYEDQANAESKNGKTRWENKFETILDLYSGPTQVGTKGTLWGALGAITEEQQWFRGFNKGKEENFFAAGAGFDNAANIQRQNAFAAVNNFAASLA